MKKNYILNELIGIASQPIDYSQKFFNSVEAICRLLYLFTGSEPFIDNNMDYSASQNIIIYLCKNRIYTNEKEADFAINILVSSRAKLYTFLLQNKEKGVWKPMKKGAMDDMKELKLKLKEIVEGLGYREVDEKYWDVNISGYFRQLDGVPANLFEVIFSEII